MRYFLLATMPFFLFFPATPAWSQFGVQDSKGPVFGPARTQRWTVGMVITANGGPCFGLFGTAPVPSNWPEQDFTLVDERISDTVRSVQPRKLAGGVVQMLVSVPRLNVGEQAEALMTYEVTRREILAPHDPSILRLPRKVPRDIGKWLGTSPLIESRNSRIRSKVKEITAGKEGGWETVEAICDWVKANIEHSNVPKEGAVEALRNQKGHNEDLTGLFIALCRAKRIPARTVWVPDYCYAEFYLEDDEGNGYWFPCELKEKTVFGTSSSQHLILQKGDNFDVPEKKEPQRFVREYLRGKTGFGFGRPSMVFVRKLAPAI